MNWTALGAIGETLGAVAVIATLAYLAIQIKQARRATLADVYQTRAHSRGAAMFKVALNSPTFHKTLFKFEDIREHQGLDAALAEMSAEERFLLRQYHADVMIRMDNVHFQYTQGFIPEDYFETVKAGIRLYAPVWKALGIDQQYPILSSELFESASNEVESS